ncbi:MAG: hypothetical protein HY042_09505 [Spirochaetia bacterium]|nr:hypothetical protein [Spirochaetia bacterium]
MRDKRFVAEHRGGPLTEKEHRQLIHWARACVEHVLPFVSVDPDPRLKDALSVAASWEKGSATVGEARQASVAAHALARDCPNKAAVALARAAGHAVATAHMADHSLGGALYALKAVRSAGNSVETERKWQKKHLPAGIRDLVLSALQEKEKHFKLD